MAETATWVSLKEASERAGVSVSWLRKQYRQNGLPTRETIGSRGPQKAVPLEEVMARAAVFAGQPPVVPPSRVAPAPPVAPAAAATAAEPPPPVAADLTVLLDRLAGVERERSLVDRLVDAERRAAQAEAEAAYLRLRLEDAFAEIDTLRQVG